MDFSIVGEKSNPINGDKERESERVEAENGAFNVLLCVESSHKRFDRTVIRYNEQLLRNCSLAKWKKKKKEKNIFLRRKTKIIKSSLKIYYEKYIYIYLKSWRETCICFPCSRREVKRRGTIWKQGISKYFSSPKDRYCYCKQEKYFEKNKRMNKILIEFLFGI